MPTNTEDLSMLVTKQVAKPAEEKPKVLTAETLGGLKIEKAIERAPFLNILVYGESGIGKTVLCGSASMVEAMSPVLILDVEGGVEPLRTMYPQVDVIRIKTIKDLQNAYNELFRGKHNYKTIVLDSLTEIQKVYMGEIMVNVVKEDSDRDPDVPGMYEWNKNTEQVRKLVRAFRDLPVNTVLTALADQRTENNLTKTVPSFSKKLIGEIPAIVDLVLYFYTKMGRDPVTKKETINRFLLTQKTERVAAKDRTTKLPVVVEEPTFSILHQLIYT